MKFVRTEVLDVAIVFDRDEGGFLVWVGKPGEQSDFVLGPYKTEEAAMQGLRREGLTRADS